MNEQQERRLEQLEQRLRVLSGRRPDEDPVDIMLDILEERIVHLEHGQKQQQSKSRS